MSDRPLTTGEGNTAREWAREYDIDCVVCPVCAFTFDKDHVTDATGEYDCPVCECGRLREQLDAARQALEVYADARNWGIMRDEFRHPSCVWIGPGATDTVPDAPGVARAALGVEGPAAGDGQP